MHNNNTITILVGVLAAATILLFGFNATVDSQYNDPATTTIAGELLSSKAFEILDTKCNVCHRKQNPLMVFKQKNMAKRAAIIYQMVFVERRMPKTEGIP